MGFVPNAYDDTHTSQSSGQTTRQQFFNLFEIFLPDRPHSECLDHSVIVMNVTATASATLYIVPHKTVRASPGCTQ